MNGYTNFRILLFSGLLILGLSACDTARNVEDPDLHYFVKYYGGDGNQRGVDMLTLADGSFLLLGNYEATRSESDIYLLRVDAEGEVLWEKRFEEDISIAKDLEPTTDGNFVVLADFQATIGGKTRVKMLKISPEGELINSIKFPLDEADPNFSSRSVTPLDDGGFIVSGTTQKTVSDTGNDPGDMFIFRFDQNLNEISVNEWGPVIHGFGQDGSQLDVAIKTIQRPATLQGPDRFYVFGYTNSNLNFTNPNGRLGLFYSGRGADGLLGTGYFPGNIVNVNDTEVHFVQEVPEQMGSGFIVIGTSQSNIGVSDIFFARLRSTLNYQMNDATLYTTISPRPNIRGVSAASSLTGEYGFLVLGNEVRSTGALNIWVSKIDQSGRILWSTTFGSELEEDFGAAITQLPDGKIVILGTMGLADNQLKMALIKVNPQGQFLK